MFYRGGMDSFDSRPAHSSEASTDEPASLLPPAEEAPPAVAPPERRLAGRRFATPAEEEAYWIGVRLGAEAANARAASPPGRHRPDGVNLDLTRDGEAAGLVSGRLVEPGATTPARALRHDGWTPEKERIFFRTLAATGVVADACRACGMSRDAAYTRRNSAAGRPFALAWDAALVLARPAMADDLISRARQGVIDRVYRNGELVAERHRYDNRLAMAVLTRLDRLAESLAERAPAAQAVANEFEQFLDILPGGNEAAEAFLAPRLGRDPLEPPHFRDAVYAPNSEPALLARATFRERHGVGLPSDIDTDDLHPAEMESWTDDQLRRAEASGLLASLEDEAWPEAVLDGEADGTDGMCKLRKLYLWIHPEEADEFGWEEE
jgi:hypothetical protein